MKKLFLVMCIAMVLGYACKKNDGTDFNPIKPPKDTTIIIDTPKVDTPIVVEPPYFNRKYNKVCFLMTHNAMNNSEKKYLIPNQTHSITKQLANGVRGLMIDTYDGPGGKALTYHGVELMGKQPLVDVLKEVYLFLANNEKEVLTIIFENNGSNEQLITAIETAGLTSFAYIHGTEWKTIKEMVNSNQRLVMFVESDKTPKADYLKHAWSYIYDTKYTFNKVSEFDCSINRGTFSENNLFLVNHWLSNGLGLPEKKLANTANNPSVIHSRLQNCENTRNHFINFLGVDFYEVGNTKAIVDSINSHFVE